MYQDSQFYVLGLPVLCVGTLSFIYCSYESEYSGLIVQILRTPSPSTPDSQSGPFGLSPVMIKSYFLVDITMTPLPPR